MITGGADGSAWLPPPPGAGAARGASTRVFRLEKEAAREEAEEAEAAEEAEEAEAVAVAREEAARQYGYEDAEDEVRLRVEPYPSPQP